MKFPSVLKKALTEEIVIFENEIEIEYEKFIAYRRISRTNGDTTPINRNDFKSYMEMPEKQRPRSAVPNDIGSYSCSLNRSVDSLKVALRLPQPNKKIMKGLVTCNYGPQLTNTINSHVHWWLYDSLEIFEDFEVTA